MRHSIKRQVAFTFIGLMAGTLLVCMFLNNVLLPGYYENRRENALLKTYEMLEQAAQEEYLSTDVFKIELEKISGRYNIMGAVQDMNGNMVGTFGNDMEILKGLLWDRIYMPIHNSAILKTTDNYTVQKVTDLKTRTDYMEMTGWLSGGQAFYMRTPLDNIKESVAVANRLLMYVGLTGSLMSSLIIWLVSKKITEPILKLTDISERMAQLDFEARYDGKGENEIALLGDNINILSKTLEETIGELKTANNELKKDIEKKTQIDEMRKEFLSNVSHELKTPIALIMGYAEGLAECVNEDAESRSFYCDVIQDEAAKMNRMVKELMSLSQLESGSDVVNMERFDVVTLICNYVQTAQILTRQYGISVRMKQYDAIYVWGDEFKTEEVFANYFTNAVNHAKGDKLIDIRLTKQENKVRISVFNTGEQIPEESIPHLWEKFYKVDKARSREYGGSGVGLSIVKAIMESMHQAYGVENYENGVFFWFELETVGKEK